MTLNYLLDHPILSFLSTEVEVVVHDHEAVVSILKRLSHILHLGSIHIRICKRKYYVV